MSSLMRYRVSVGESDAPLSSRDLVVDLNTRHRRAGLPEPLHFVLAPDVEHISDVPTLTVALACTPAAYSRSEIDRSV